MFWYMYNIVKMITTIKLIDISLPHIVTILEREGENEYLTSPLLANFKLSILFKFEDYFCWVYSELRASFLK